MGSRDSGAFQRFQGVAGRTTTAVVLLLLGAGCAVLFLALLLAGGDDDATSVATPARSGRAVAPSPVANIQVGEETDTALIQTATTPVIASHPDNPDNLVMGYRIERPAYSCAVQVSFDAGRSWDPAKFDLPPATERCYTTSLGYDKDGAVHLAFVTLAGPGNVPSAAWLTKSTDGGRTFAPATQVLDGEKFMVRLAVDRRTSPATLHLTYVEASGVGLLQMVPPSAVLVKTSTDGGATFGEPVRVSPTRRELVGAPVPVVDKDGALHVLYYDYRRDVFDFRNLEGSYGGTIELVVGTSTDGGATFTESTVDSAIRPPEHFLVFTPPFPSMAADDRTGKLFVAWADKRTGRSIALLSTSDDGARTWARPARVDDEAGEAYLPQVAVADSGRLDLVYASVGDGQGKPTEIRFTASTDGGRTFGPARPLNEPFSRELLPRSPRRDAGPDFGSALGLASRDSMALVAWPDTRRGGTDTFRVDIVAAPVELTRGAPARRVQPASS